MKLAVPLLALVLATGAVAVDDGPDQQKQPPVKQKRQLTEEQTRQRQEKKAARLAQRKQLTEEQVKALQEKRALKTNRLTDEQTKARQEKSAQRKKQLTDERQKALAEKKATRQRKPVQLTSQAHVEKAVSAAPVVAEFEMAYRPIEGLPGQSQWHIVGTSWWVRLHGAPGVETAALDKAKTYRVTGVVLEQNYGVVEVWVQKLGQS